MRDYPFDLQKCLGDIETKDPFVRLIGKKVTYDGPKDLMDYVVIGNPFFHIQQNVNISKIYLYRKINSLFNRIQLGYDLKWILAAKS